MKDRLRSPFFYVGDKYKIMPQIISLFPSKIKNYYEPFLGGGSSALYVNADKYLLNDLNINVINLHKHLCSYVGKEDKLFEELFSIIKEYKLSCSYLGIEVPKELKLQHIKTYYAKFNKSSYSKLRETYNLDRDLSKLYILLVYGFNHMIRFNRRGEFNLPVGNVDFNKNVYHALTNYLKFASDKDLAFYNLDYIDFIKSFNFEKGDFVYLDPPYLISNSEYNKDWSIEDENRLYDLIDYLDKKEVFFGLSNLLDHKGQSNDILKERMKKYKVFEVKSNYISRFDNTIKKDSKEIYITNYEKS